MRPHALRALWPLRSLRLPLSPSAIPPTRPVSTWKPRQRTAPWTNNTNTKAAQSTEDGITDPQPAIPPAATVEDVDPSLSTPTVSSPLSAAPGFSTNPHDGEASLPSENWSTSFHGLATNPFPPETAAVLMRPIDPLDVEIKPDGIVYLPEIKYRRILNQAFGPGAWGMAPRGETVVGEKVVTREYALIVHGRFIAQARGECQYFSEETIPTAGEGCKSNALLRCCKDLGIASELWDPRFIREFKKKYAKEIWVEHVVTKKKRQVWTLKDTDPAYPYQVTKSTR